MAAASPLRCKPPLANKRRKILVIAAAVSSGQNWSRIFVTVKASERINVRFDCFIYRLLPLPRVKPEKFAIRRLSFAARLSPFGANGAANFDVCLAASLAAPVGQPRRHFPGPPSPPASGSAAMSRLPSEISYSHAISLFLGSHRFGTVGLQVPSFTGSHFGASCAPEL
jgi:hypothetical protein